MTMKYLLIPLGERRTVGNRRGGDPELPTGIRRVGYTRQGANRWLLQLTTTSSSNPTLLLSTSIMSVSLQPSATLGFPSTCSSRFSLPFIQDQLSRLSGPLTQTVKRTLTISNNNVQPVAFKVKTTAPKVCLCSQVLQVRLQGCLSLRSGPLVVLRTTKFRSGGARPERRGPR